MILNKQTTILVIKKYLSIQFKKTALYIKYQIKNGRQPKYWSTNMSHMSLVSNIYFISNTLVGLIFLSCIKKIANLFIS